MNTEQNWFLGERAEQLATLYLTRRDDLTVIPQPKQFGTDLLVSIKKEGQESGRFFAVEVKGSLTGQSSKIQFNPRWMNEAALQDIPFPVCLFVFQMDDDSGYWKWLREPLLVQTHGGLRTNLNDELKRLDNRMPLSVIELTNIVDTVNSWYDSRQSRHLAAAR